MNRTEVATQITTLLQPIAAQMGLVMVDVQLHGDSKRTVLRVLMDRPEGGITVEECARVSERLGRQLDLYDLIPHAYTLEVSSPGLDRPLRSEGEFRQFAGRSAEIVVHEPRDGQRRFRGMLLGVIADQVVLQLDDRQVQIPLERIATARLVVEMGDVRADLHRGRAAGANR